MSLITPVGHTVSALEFKRKYGKSAMKTLAEIAVNYEYGVNENRNVYFRPYDETVNERFWIGKGELREFEGEEVESKYNAYKVLCGQLSKGDNFILEVSDVPEGEHAKWGILELPEAIPPFGSNIAAGCSVATSPTGTGASNLVDGDVATEWNSGAYQQLGDYIQVDLGSEIANIGKVVVDSTEIANKTTDFADGFKVLVASAVVGSSMISPTEVFAATEEFGSNYVAVTFPTESGKYVRVEITDAKPYFWRVGEFGVYQWGVGDIRRWAEGMLASTREPTKKGKLVLSEVNRKISPRGKARITSRDGLVYNDYPMVSAKYKINAKLGLQCSLALGETMPSIADELLRMQREITERRLMSSVKSSDLSMSIWTQEGSDQKVPIDSIETAMLTTDSIYAKHYHELRNTYVFSDQDSLDAVKSFEMDFEIVSEMTSIETVKLSFRIRNFRAYATGVPSGGGHTTAAGGGATSGATGSASGGGHTTPAGGGHTTPSGGGHTSGSRTHGHSVDTGDNTTDHYHKIQVTTGGEPRHDLWYRDEDHSTRADRAGYMTTGNNESDHVHVVSIAAGGAHDHAVYDHQHAVSNHQHTVSNHTHPNHQHTTPAHQHTVSNHTHSLTFGIFEDSQSPTLNVFIDNGVGYGTSIGEYTTDQLDIDISAHVSGTGFKRIKFESTARARVSSWVMCKIDLTA